MKPSMLLRMVMACVTLGLIAVACNNVEQVVNVEPLPGGTPGPGTGNIVGRVGPAASRARVIAEQAGPVDSTTIDEVSGAFAVVGLRPGTYDVVVRADNHRIARLERVAVYAGSVSYVGSIVLSTTPDPVRSFAPADRSEVVMYSAGNRLAIGIDFEVPMDRASVQAAFSTQPPTTGVFFWSQFPSATSTDFTGSRESDVAPPGYREIAPGGEITTYRNVRSLRFIPRQRDTFVDSAYVVTLSSAAQDSAGNAMRFALHFSFATIQSGVSQTTIETQPEDGARNVSLLGYSSLRITFPRRMDRSSVESALTITPSTVPIFLWLADNDLSLYTGGPLRAATTYTVHIDATARDLDGLPLGTPFEFSFETEPVAIRSVSPSNGQVFVDFSTNLRIYLAFNTYIVRSTLAPAWSIVPAASGQFVWSDNTSVYFQPYAPLSPNTRYTVTIDAALRDLHGSSLPSPYSFAFVTRPE
jgi:hypothetical protein